MSNRRIKVCLFSTTHAPLDARIFYREARTLSRNGYDVTILTPARFDVLVQDGVKIIGLGTATGKLARFFNLWRVFWLALRQDADIYHFHDMELCLVGWLLHRLKDKPVIYDVHENFPEFMLDKAWLPMGLRRPIGCLVKAYELWVARRIQGIIVVNQLLKERFEKVNTHVVLLGNYPPRVSALSRQYAQLSENMSSSSCQLQDLIYIGPIGSDRGLDVMVDVIKQLHDRYPQLRLLLLGPIMPEAKKIMDGPVEDWTNSVQWLGVVPHEELHSYLHRSLAGLLLYQPSLNNILGTPNKLFEYMAAGLPVVCSNFVFMRQYVESAQCGLLVDPQDSSAVSDAVEKLLQDPRDARAMGERGRQAVVNQFCWETVERDLLSLYASLVKQFLPSGVHAVGDSELFDHLRARE